MKIVKILGGLGNQMFQYSLFQSLKMKFPEEDIYVDCSLFNGYPFHNALELDRIFSLDLPQATFGQLLKTTWPFYHYRLWQMGKRILPMKKACCFESLDCAFDKTILSRNGNRYFDGYWQNEKYFKQVASSIRECFSFKEELDSRNKSLLEKIYSNKGAVSIHIRRGDYLKHQLYRGICELDYYRQAIQEIRRNVEKPVFYIFSNDIKWCKENLSSLLTEETLYVDWNKGEDSYKDMQLMSACHHNIIANSSFSWWAAWLNRHEDKIVISPRKWLNRECGDIQLENWIKI